MKMPTKRTLDMWIFALATLMLLQLFIISQVEERYNELAAKLKAELPVPASVEIPAICP